MAGDVRACHAYSGLLGLFLRLSRNFFVLCVCSRICYYSKDLLNPLRQLLRLACVGGRGKGKLAHFFGLGNVQPCNKRVHIGS